MTPHFSLFEITGILIPISIKGILFPISITITGILFPITGITTTLAITTL